VPLFAVVLADHVVARRARRARAAHALRPATIVCWLLGAVTYQWIIPTGPAWWTTWVTDHVAQAGRHAWLGASLPSFVVSFVLTVAVGLGTARHGVRRTPA
jgi:hypothetical protein